MIKTQNISGETLIDLSKSENNSYFYENQKFCRIDNKSNGSIYVSLSPNISTGKDGVLEITSGGSGILELSATNKIYVSGSGKIQIQTSSVPFDITINSGSGGSSGGSGGGGNGEENVIEIVKVNGEALTVAPDKSVNIGVPTKTSELQNDNGYINSIPDTYATKTYVGEQIAGVDKLTRSIVEELPTDEQAQDNVIYMIRVADISGNDKYEEYMKIDGTLQLIGDTSVDLSEYVKSSDLNTQIETLNQSIGQKADKDNVIAKDQIGDGLTIDENGVLSATGGDSGGGSVNVQADFLTADGFGNLRYYNGHFQYNNGTDWIDTSVTPDNVYVMNMIPQAMQFINGIFDVKSQKYKLKWLEPTDTIINGQVACVVEKVIIRRKLNSVPIDENDGDLVVEVNRRDFGTYKNSYFVDNELVPNVGDVYYYKAFPVSTTGFYNASSLNETSGIICKDYELYGFKIDQNESDPASMITYLNDCDNAKYRSAYMDYSADTFNYGDWKDAFFMQVKPCMLKYDGTVDYYLDPNDYSKREGGTNSDIADDTYEGNVMIQFPKTYWKIVDNGDDTANVYICSKKLDDNFHCWSHIDNNGNEIDYCYMPAYNGYSDGTRLRSLSGKTPIQSKTVLQEISLAVANNPTDDAIWYTEVFSDRTLVNLLLLLIGKSTDTQSIFGAGNNISKERRTTGTLDTKGLFWGSQDNVSSVKIFGIENWWANQFRRVAGWINDKGTQKVKMTYGQFDGSTVDGYNTTGEGYISILNATSDVPSVQFISKMVFDTHGLFPKTANGSSTTYYTDAILTNNSIVTYAETGGPSDQGANAGAFTLTVYTPISDAHYIWIGASISCKPLAVN